MGQVGKAVSFGFAGTDGIAETTFLTGKIILQNADFAKTADEEQVRSAAGELCNRSFYNNIAKASLEYVVTGANIAGVTGNLTDAAIPAPGALLNITACASLPALIKTNWVVVGEPKVSGSNTTAKRISLPIEAADGITVVVS